MDSKDQSNNPEASPIKGNEEFPPHPAPLSDSPVGAPLSVGHAQPRMGTWQAPSPEELQGQFSQYEIRGALGRGGMGAVYKGWQTSLQRFVAIKILPSDIEDDGMEYAERFKQEARAMAQFKHPGIVAVYDAGETREKLLYFVMECVEGKDVAQIVTERGRLEPAEALSITSRVCEAMAYAHERGVIHRDIKPSNVMIESDGRVKVSDFGLAKLSSAERSVNTANSLQIGSLDFMPPEALRGSENVDHRGDIYAVGGMLYQMLTGRAPHGRFEPPSVAVPGLDRRFDAIVDKAMHADAAQRYPSAREMQAELERIAPTLPAPAARGTVNTSGPSRRPVSKPLLATLLATAVVCITSIAFAVRKKNHTQVPPGRSAPPDPNAGETADIPNAKPAIAARWHDAFGESPLREVIASAGRTAQGYRLPENNHWPISPQSIRSGALRVRATAIGEKFASLYIAHDDRQTERVRFLARTSEWLLASGGVGSTGETNLATKSGASPLDEMPHELLLARIGGRLRVLVDGKSLLNEPDPSSAAGKFVLDIFPDAKISAEKVEYLDLDDVPEAEALKQIGMAPEGKDFPRTRAGASPTAAKAAKDAPFVNSLGMKFVPVPIAGGPTGGQRVLFSVWETRVRDYGAFANETKRTWAKPPFPQDSAHPAVGVNGEDAQAFCTWLTKRERASGDIGAKESYRLPADHEWSCAVGIGEREDPAKAPSLKAQAVADLYPWGASWPPPPNAGNYSGEEVLGHEMKKDQTSLAGYRDAFIHTSPVGSFAANRFGLFDLGGNAWELCEDPWKNGEPLRVIRGASFGSANRIGLLSCYRDSLAPDIRTSSVGFRVVLSATPARRADGESAHR